MAELYKIPVQNVPNQTLTVSLPDGNNYDIFLRTMLNQLYLSYKKNDEYVIENRICENKNPIDQFVFINIDDNSNTSYDMLNIRSFLYYIY